MVVEELLLLIPCDHTLQANFLCPCLCRITRVTAFDSEDRFVCAGSGSRSERFERCRLTLNESSSVRHVWLGLLDGSVKCLCPLHEKKVRSITQIFFLLLRARHSLAFLSRAVVFSPPHHLPVTPIFCFTFSVFFLSLSLCSLSFSPSLIL